VSSVIVVVFVALVDAAAGSVPSLQPLCSATRAATASRRELSASI
jgi:hypothetical protein